jgi:hypothetical protein
MGWKFAQKGADQRLYKTCPLFFTAQMKMAAAFAHIKIETKLTKLAGLIYNLQINHMTV